MLCDVTQCYLNSIFEILEHFVILENLQIKCEEKKRKILKKNRDSQYICYQTFHVNGLSDFLFLNLKVSSMLYH